MAAGERGSGIFSLAKDGRPAGRPTAFQGKAYQEMKSSVHRDLLNRVDLEKLMHLQDGQARSRLFAVIQELVGELDTPLSARERDQLGREVLDEVFGLGPLEPLLQDPTINDILVNTHQHVYVERGGVIEKTNVVFKDNAHLMHIIDKIVSAVGRRVDESSPMVDARLPDGSRINIIIPPLAVDGPAVSIRRFGIIPLEAEDLLANKTWTPPMMEILMTAVKARLNIVISGGTGAGKTTFLNILSSAIPATSASSASRTRPSCSSSRSMWCAWSAAPRTWRAKARCGNANWSSTRCACAPTASSWARCAARKRWTCCRP